MQLNLLQTYLESLLYSAISADLSYYFFEKIPSTNQILWDYLEQGKNSLMVAIAAEQTAGRGQWGRVWQSGLGGLYLSLLLPLNLPLDSAPHLTLLSGVGIAQMLRQSQIPVQLKWPNDLILKGHKLGGIKSETRSQHSQLTYGVIGVGLNWQNQVPSVGINLRSYLGEQFLDTITSLEQLAALTLAGLLNSYHRYQKEGIEPILADYLNLFQNLGKYITLEGCQGKIIGVTSQGELQVRLASQGAKTELCLSPGTVTLGYDGCP